MCVCGCVIVCVYVIVCMCIYTGAELQSNVLIITLLTTNIYMYVMQYSHCQPIRPHHHQYMLCQIHYLRRQTTIPTIQEFGRQICWWTNADQNIERLKRLQECFLLN
jgi:hypothetical protein